MFGAGQPQFHPEHLGKRLVRLGRNLIGFIIDRQGDVIEPETLVKAVNNYMEHVRVGKTMHVGEQTGVIVHSMPVTKEIGEALGIHSDREGWIVAYKVYDDAVWDMVKSGELAAFSIGGRAVKEDWNA